MDGRWFTVAFLEVLPILLIALTIWKFGSNPLSIFVLLGAMVAGGFYLITYSASFGPAEPAP
jgi:hypothetical protein